MPFVRWHRSAFAGRDPSKHVMVVGGTDAIESSLLKREFAMRWFGTRRDTLASRLMVPVVILGTLITVLGAVYLVTQSRRTIEKQALQSAESIAYQIG